MVFRPVSMLNQVGSTVALASIGVGRPVDAAVVAHQQDAGRAGHESQRVLVDVHDIVAPL